MTLPQNDITSIVRELSYLMNCGITLELYGLQGQDLSFWETGMTNPRNHDDSRFRYLIHAVQDTHSVVRPMQMIVLCEQMKAGDTVASNKMDLLETPQRISEKPIISTSLIDQSHTETWASGGYILEASLDNILKTASSDIGTNFGGGSDLVTKLYQERDCKGIASPYVTLKFTSPKEYNEIVVAGTGRTDKKVQIHGVFVKVFPNGQYVDAPLAQKLVGIAKRNNWPVVRIKERVEVYEDKDPYVNDDKTWFALHSNGLRYFLNPVDQDFLMMENGGKTSRSMTPVEREYALGKVRDYLLRNDLPDLQRLADVAEAFPDEILSEKVRSEYELTRKINGVGDYGSEMLKPFKKEFSFIKISDLFSILDLKIKS